MAVPLSTMSNIIFYHYRTLLQVLPLLLTPHSHTILVTLISITLLFSYLLWVNKNYTLVTCISIIDHEFMF